MKPLKIVRLQSTNIKRLKAIDITPNSNVVTVAGKNDNGKSSTLDSITYCLAGKDAICEQPIREGQSKAEILCDLGDIIAVRKFTRSGTNVTVTAKDGTPLKSPQAVLDSLWNKVTFDPSSFIKMQPKDQMDALRRLVGLDFTKLEADKAKAYNERRDVNRSLEVSKAKLSAFTEEHGLPEEEVKVSDLMAELEAIQKRNAAQDVVKSRLEAAKNDAASKQRLVDNISLEIANIEAMLAKKKAEQSQLISAADKAKLREEEVAKEVAALVYEDEAPVKERISQADDLNARIRSNNRRKELAKEVADLEAKSESLTNSIEDLEAEKRTQLANAKFPLQGLSFNDAGVLLNGVPFEQGSTARKLQAAVAIGLALNPKLRVVLIREGNDLDDDSLALLREMADKQDFQVWIEQVRTNDPSAIVIEDGAVKE